MLSPADHDSPLIDRIRRGDDTAWNELIARYEGRLLAFVESRLARPTAAEDIVQETFIGFLNSLPHYDGARPLESYLFSICAYKLTDHLRREGRRPAISLAALQGAAADESNSGWNPTSSDRVASSIARSGERRGLEEQALVTALGALLERWQTKGEWDKLMCAELIFVRGRGNKDVATLLNLSEQTVANYKFELIAKLKTAMRKQQLPDDVFPELTEAR